MTPGTDTQFEMTRLTELFGATLWPAPGLCAATVPLGEAAGQPCDCDPTFNPFCARIAPALAGDWPSTLGTGTAVCVPDTVSTTGMLALMLVPPAGFWLMTKPTGWLLLMYLTL